MKKKRYSDFISQRVKVLTSGLVFLLTYKLVELKDILIASVDGLKGFLEAINAIFPQTEVQLCIVHQIRNSIRYVVSKEQKEFAKDLKLIYQAPTKEIAEDELLKLGEKWGKKIPTSIKPV